MTLAALFREPRPAPGDADLPWLVFGAFEGRPVIICACRSLPVARGIRNTLLGAAPRNGFVVHWTQLIDGIGVPS